MKAIKAIGLSLAVCGLAAAAEEAPDIAAQISALEGKWTTKKIEITAREAFGSVTAEDRMTITFDSKGGTHWALDLKASGQKPELNLL